MRCESSVVCGQVTGVHSNVALDGMLVLDKKKVSICEEIVLETMWESKGTSQCVPCCLHQSVEEGKELLRPRWVVQQVLVA